MTDLWRASTEIAASVLPPEFCQAYVQPRQPRVAGEQPQPAVMLVDMEVHGTAPSDPVRVFRVANMGWASGVHDEPASVLWQARMLGDIDMSQSAIDAVGVGGLVALTVVDFELFNQDKALSDAVRYGTADGRSVTIRAADALPSCPVLLGADGAVLTAFDSGAVLTAGNPEASLADFPIGWTGHVRAISASKLHTATVSAVDVAERLATPLQASRYAGTGGLEGPLALKDAPRPVCLGQVFNIEPIALGNIDLGDGTLPTYQSHWRAIVAHDVVRIRGVAQEMVTGTRPSVGQARDYPALGMFQLGSSPDGAVTADVRGDSVGGYADSTGGILRRLLLSLGPKLSAADLHVTAWDYAEYDLPGVVGWYRGTADLSASEAAQGIVAGSGAVLCGNRNGLLRLFDPLVADATQIDLQPEWMIDLHPVPMPAGLRPLPRAVAIAWRRNWKPLSDLAGSVAGDARQQLVNDSSGPARVESAVLTARVAQPRDLRFAGLYWNESEAAARARKWLDWLETGPRIFEVRTDRFLGQIECGDIATITFPGYGLEAGVKGVVVAWRESLAARRLTMTICTLPGA